MSACPKPPVKKKSAHTTKKKTATKKVAVSLCPPPVIKPSVNCGCGGGSGSVGPQGPIGPQGPAGPAGANGSQGICGKGFNWKGDWASGQDYYTANPPSACSSDVVFNKGTAYIAILDHLGTSDDEPGVGADWETYWDIFVEQPAEGGGTGNVVYRGVWAAGVNYVEYDFVTHLGSDYICTLANTADLGNEPDVDFDYNGGSNWMLMSLGGTPTSQQEQLSLLDSIGKQISGITDGVMDWIKNIPNWGVSDWLKNIAIGAAAVWAGSKLLDLINTPPTDVGGVTYNGSSGYSGSYNIPKVADVLADLLQRAGLSPAEYDLSLVPDLDIEGGLLDNPTAKTAIDNIALTYQLNWVNIAGVMKFTPRLQNSVGVMGDGEFGYHELTSDNTGPFTMKRMQSVDLPKRVTVQYISRDLDYAVFSQETPMLESFPSGKDVTISVPFVLTPLQARDVGDYSLIQAHLERNTWTGTTTYKWATLEPGDVVQTGKGFGRVIQITEKTEGLIDIVFADAGLPSTPQPIYSGPVIIGYTASDYVGSGIPPTPEPIATITGPKVGGPTGVFVIDCPSLQNGDNLPRVMLAIHGYGNPQWMGGYVFKSVDGGNTYSQIGYSTQSATFGVVTIPSANPTNYHDWDTNTVISIEVKSGTLTSKTAAEVLNGSNTCMIGSEVIGFQTATLTGTSSAGNKVYSISNLIRGRLGTEWVFDNYPSHIPNELFVMLDDTLQYAACDMSESRMTTAYKAVSVGGDISQSIEQDYNVALINQVPWKVANPVAHKDVTSKIFNVTWEMRSRSMGDGLEDSTEIENDPDFGGYVVAVLDGSGNEKRKWQVNTPYTSYTLAQQTQDFGSEQTYVTFRIAGLNRLYGSGYKTDFSST